VGRGSGARLNDYLVLRFDAPLQSFGGVAVDAHRVSDESPGRSLVVGLLGNALGWSHGDFARLQRLQERVVLGVRRDRSGQRMVDFHTVDLGQDHLKEDGWTTRGRTASREGGSASSGTHIRHRHFLADAVYTLVVTLRPHDEEPSLDHLEDALRHPARPLFLGRKSALPAAPIFVMRVTAGTARDALASIARIGRRGDEGSLSAWWPAEEGGEDASSRLVPVFDDRDWANQIHAGRRFLRHGTVDPRGGPDAR